ncbi:MAG: hypothetical protein Q8R79_01215 [Legionellaceae bacterium]|nr:hypothetical protein [Legionellaceae bacterium]
MSVEDFIITVYCLVDVELKKITHVKPLISRGYAPKLSDAEVITIDIVGEFLSKDTDAGIWRYFKNHWQTWFPGLGRGKDCNRWITSTRRLVETVIGQLAEQFHIEKIRARDVWYLTNRIGRNILAHKVGIVINKILGNPPLQFEQLGVT